MPAQPEKPNQAPIYVLDESVLAQRKTVLILEDDVEFAEMLKLSLEDYSFGVTRVTTGVEGVREIIASDFDLILCDLVMPKLSGDMFYLAVERTKPHLCRRFIFMTGHHAEPKWEEFIRKVNGVVIWKPFSLLKLRNMMQQVLENQ